MRVIPPLTITNAMLSSSIPEPDVGESVWNIATGYAAGNQVYVASTHKIYECTTASTGAPSPEVAVLRTDSKWIEVGSTNRWGMFDLYRNTTSTSTSPITFSLTPGVSVDSIAILGLVQVSSIVITATSVTGGGQVFSKSFNTSERSTFSWYEYFFGTFYTNSTVIAFDLPSQYTDLVITVVCSGYGTIGVGAVVIGTSKYIGSLQNGASNEALNFSIIDRDSWGDAVLVPRRSIPKTVQTTYIDKSLLKEVHTTKDLLDAVPAVWSGLDDSLDHDYFHVMIILGFYRSFTFDLNNPIGVMCNIELEEI
jgi:hypothetical protein